MAVIGASPYRAEPVWDEDGILDGIADAKTDSNAAVSYTHLDVYKRQLWYCRLPWLDTFF